CSFFFSSRRRHTRSTRDWSSDVCSSDLVYPDTYSHFYADLQMYNIGMNAPDPQVFMAVFVSWEIASRENKWVGRNITRFRSDERSEERRVGKEGGAEVERR